VVLSHYWSILYLCWHHLLTSCFSHEVDAKVYYILLYNEIRKFVFVCLLNKTLFLDFCVLPIRSLSTNAGELVPELFKCVHCLWGLIVNTLWVLTVNATELYPWSIYQSDGSNLSFSFTPNCLVDKNYWSIYVDLTHGEAMCFSLNTSLCVIYFAAFYRSACFWTICHRSL
jgi:hypothetical protein